MIVGTHMKLKKQTYSVHNSNILSFIPTIIASSTLVMQKRFLFVILIYIYIYIYIYGEVIDFGKSDYTRNIHIYGEVIDFDKSDNTRKKKKKRKVDKSDTETD